MLSFQSVLFAAENRNKGLQGKVYDRVEKTAQWGKTAVFSSCTEVQEQLRMEGPSEQDV